MSTAQELFIAMESQQVVRAAGIPIKLNSMSAIAKAFAVPQTEPPMRLPSFPAVERTSVMSFNATRTLAIDTTPSRGLLTRQAMFPLWLERSVSGCYVATLLPAMNPPAGQGHVDISPATTPASWQLMTAVAGQTVVDGAYTRGTNAPPTIPVYGSPLEPGYPWFGIDGEASGLYFYAPSTFSLVLAVTNVPTPSTYNSAEFLVDVYISPGEFRTITLTATGFLGTNSTGSPPEVFDVSSYWYAASCSTAFGQNAWFRLRSIVCKDSSGGKYPIAGPVIVVVAPSVGVSVTSAGEEGLDWTITYNYINAITTSGSAYALAPGATTSAFTSSAIPFVNTRLTAVASLFTNVTKVLDKEGTVLAARFNPEQTDIFNLTSASYQDVHPTEKYFYGLEQGFYNYAAPSTDLANFYDYTVQPSSGTSLPVFRLDNAAMANAWQFSDPTGGSTLAVNLDWHIEFRNSSQLWPIGMSVMTLESLHSAQLAMASAGCFFDNIDHKWILNKLAAATRWLAPALDQTLPTRLAAQAILAADKRWGSSDPPVKEKSRSAREKRPKPPQPKPAPKRQGGLSMALAEYDRRAAATRQQASVPKKPPGQPRPTKLG